MTKTRRGIQITKTRRLKFLRFLLSYLQGQARKSLRNQNSTRGKERSLANRKIFRIDDSVYHKMNYSLICDI